MCLTCHAMPSGNTSYSDFTAPTGYLYYVVEIMLDAPCVLHKNLSSIKSNIATNKSTVSIVETDCNESVRIFPNPAFTQLHVKIDTQEIADYSIYNVVGQIVLQGKLQEDSTINVELLANGMYYLRIAGKTVKFVKE